jgi:hypothetical protein
LTAPGDVQLRFAVRGMRREVVEREWRDADQWLKRFE